MFYWWSDEPPGVLRSLNLTYAKGLYLKIYVRNVRHQPRMSLTHDFDFMLFQKETISDLVLDRDFFEKAVAKEIRSRR